MAQGQQRLLGDVSLLDGDQQMVVVVAGDDVARDVRSGECLGQRSRQADRIERTVDLDREPHRSEVDRPTSIFGNADLDDRGRAFRLGDQREDAATEIDPLACIDADDRHHLGSPLQRKRAEHDVEVGLAWHERSLAAEKRRPSPNSVAGPSRPHHHRPMPIEVRRAEETDAEAVANAHVEAWRVGYRGIVPDAYLDGSAFAEARRSGWRRLLARDRDDSLDDDDHVFVPVVEGQAVGFGHVGPATESAPGVGELHGFYIHPDHWGSGAADAVMAQCLDHLESGYERAVLWTLRDAGRARRFYERWGWVCGEGATLVEAQWPGPEMDGVPMLAEPLAEVQYRHELGPSGGIAR